MHTLWPLQGLCEKESFLEKVYINKKLDIHIFLFLDNVG